MRDLVEQLWISLAILIVFLLVIWGGVIWRWMNKPEVGEHER